MLNMRVLPPEVGVSIALLFEGFTLLANVGIGKFAGAAVTLRAA